MFYGNLAQLGKKSNSVIRSRSVTGSKIGVMSYQWRMSLYVVIIQNVVQHSGERDLILFGKIPVSTIELPKRRFQTFLDIFLPEKLIWKSHRPQNKTFIRGATRTSFVIRWWYPHSCCQWHKKDLSDSWIKDTRWKVMVILGYWTLHHFHTQTQQS